MKLINELHNLYTPLKPEVQAQWCILWRSMVTNPLMVESPVRMWEVIINNSVFTLRRLQPDDNERVIATLCTEAHDI